MREFAKLVEIVDKAWPVSRNLDCLYTKILSCSSFFLKCSLDCFGSQIIINFVLELLSLLENLKKIFSPAHFCHTWWCDVYLLWLTEKSKVFAYDRNTTCVLFNHTWVIRHNKQLSCDVICYEEDFLQRKFTLNHVLL